MSEFVDVNGVKYRAKLVDGQITEIRRYHPNMLEFRVIINYFLRDILSRRLGLQATCRVDIMSS